ncbi:MAG: hypothetical protein CM1200mP14_13230 [Gammaproteobacteria bacterium]|nr:MAG: hypothetical protein CM1200mP14_13230 [Gammaproteobacteria bacterium]
MSRDNDWIDRTIRLAALVLVAGLGVFATVGLTRAPDDVPVPGVTEDRSVTGPCGLRLLPPKHRADVRETSWLPERGRKPRVRHVPQLADGSTIRAR